jgi:hypothetical protein
MRRGALGLRCGTPWRLPSDRPHIDSNGVLAWYWESATNPKADTPNPAKRFGAVGFLLSSGGGECQLLF